MVTDVLAFGLTHNPLNAVFADCLVNLTCDLLYQLKKFYMDGVHKIAMEKSLTAIG